MDKVELSSTYTNSRIRHQCLRSFWAIYVGPETARRLSEAFALRDLGRRAFKNVRAPVVVYEVLAHRAMPEMVRA